MIKDLNWHTLEQQHIDSWLTLMYKITYDLVAIPAADYLIPNTRQSRHNHQLAYRQIPTLKDYYKYTFFSHTIVLPFYIAVYCLTYNGTVHNDAKISNFYVCATYAPSSGTYPLKQELAIDMEV